MVEPIVCVIEVFIYQKIKRKKDLCRVKAVVASKMDSSRISRSPSFPDEFSERKGKKRGTILVLWRVCAWRPRW